MQFIWPLHDHIVTRDFYYKASLYVGGQHAALDLVRRTGPTHGAPIRTVAAGAVAKNDWDQYSGNLIAVDHADGWRSTYRHLSVRSQHVVGSQLAQGQIIGNVGNTGVSQGDHLHFDLWNRNKIRDDNAIFYKNGWYALDPIKYLGQEDDMATLEQRVQMHEQYHGQTLEPQLKNLMDRVTGLEQARDSLIGEVAALQRDIASILTTSGGVSEARVRALIRSAKLTI